MSSTMEQIASAICWGCGLEVSLPGQLTGSFKCGWCGAITVEKQGAKFRQAGPARWYWLRDFLTSSVLVLLILLLIGGGVSATYPVVFPSLVSPSLYVHSAYLLFLSFNLFFDYYAALKGPAGVVFPLPFGSSEAAPKGALDNCTFCDRCKRPKPSRAHHCRACGTCVMGMDHHCPFVANCVGADNQRAFMLLLVYAILSCSYALGMATWALFKMAPEVVSLARASQDSWAGFAGGFPTSEDVFSLLFSVRVRINVRLIALIYLAALSASITLAASFLLKQQLAAVFSGETMVDSMVRVDPEMGSGRLVDNSWSAKLKRLDRVLGKGRSGGRWRWFMPRWPRANRLLTKHVKAR